MSFLEKVSIYFKYYLLQLKVISYNKLAFVVSSLFDLTTPLFFILLWSAVTFLSKNGKVGEYDQYSIAAYFLIGSILQKFASTSSARNIVKIIKNNFDFPASFYFFNNLNFAICMALDFLARITSLVLINITFVVLAIAFFPKLLSAISNDIFNILSFIIFCIIGFILAALYNSIIGLLRFYTVSANSYRAMMFNVVGILSGQFIPLALLPTLFKQITLFLPFGFTYYFPISIILGKKSREEVLIGLGISIFWMVVMFLIARKMYKKGITYYENLD